MTPEEILRELARIAGRLGRWQAQWRATITAAAVLIGLWIFTLSDMALRYNRGGRVAIWTLLMLGLVSGLYTIIRALARRRPARAVAARIEQCFPQLDNHLINYVQFAALPQKNPLISAYLQAGVPSFREIEIKAMKDRRAHRRAAIGLLVAAVLLMAPTLWAGSAWTNAMLRIINPFSARTPSTLARIIDVQPGDHAVLAGGSVLLECFADGQRGQEVFLEIWPDDDQRSVISLDTFKGDGVEEFAHHISSVTAGLRYRFRAGDDRSAIYRINTLAPLAFTRIEIEVDPPEYTGYLPDRFSILDDHVDIPEGSEVILHVECNRPLVSGELVNAGHAPVTLEPTKNGSLTGKMEAACDIVWNLIVNDANGLRAESELKLDILPDQAPILEVISPTARTTLGPGARARISWEAMDDYGLRRIVLEQMEPDAQPNDEGWPVTEWDADGRRQFSATWTGTDLPAGIPSVFRLVAIDNRPGEPNRTQSALIVFDVGTASDVVQKEKDAVAKALESFSSMVELQRETLERTEQLRAVLADARPQHWREVGVRQNEVRRIAGALLANPAKPLGPMSEMVRSLFHGPMTDVLDVVSRVMTADDRQQGPMADQVILLQKRILRALTQVDSQMDRIQENRDIAGIISMLESLIQNQSRLISDTSLSLAEQRDPERSLANRQDRLANDVFEFLRLCRDDADRFMGNNPEFADTLRRVADYCETQGAAESMLIAAAHLEDRDAGAALEPQQAALETLEHCMNMLDSWRGEEALEKMDMFADTLANAIDKFEKMIDLQGQVVDSIRQVGQQDDKSKEDMDHLGAELKEIRENMKETLLQLANDLHIFPELPVGNDLVQDVFQVFEDVEQREGSETGEVSELGIGKNEDSSMELLEAMKDFKERLEDMEQWLPDEPNRLKVEAESFDQEEFPNDIPIIPMASEMEDVIGDLLEKLDQGHDTDDTATNIGQPDVEAGWEVTEGQVTTYSAKGMSGNEEPDHKEQDGRSNIGRQGMSDGETAAGSGAISEGDDDIQERMTQDSAQSGHVEEFSDPDEVDVVATGGGKQAGHTEELGMSGDGPRRDALSQEPSQAGWDAMMRRDAEALYARASLSHVKTGSLDEAIRHLRHAEEAAKHGLPLQQIQEHRRRASAALRRSLTQLGPGIPSDAMELDYSPPHIEDQIAGAAEEAPAIYRDLVSEYFKALGNAP